MSKMKKTNPHISTQKLVEQLHDDMRGLSSFLMLPDKLVTDFNSNTLAISKSKDKKIRIQINLIEQKLCEASSALTSETQNEPLDQKSMNNNMEDIILEAAYIHTSITIRSKSKGSRDYTTGLKRMKTALNNFFLAVDKYNKIAASKNWPAVQSYDESRSIVMRRIDAAYNDLI